jgi:hypothetical protein
MDRDLAEYTRLTDQLRRLRRRLKDARGGDNH